MAWLFRLIAVFVSFVFTTIVAFAVSAAAALVFISVCCLLYVILAISSKDLGLSDIRRMNVELPKLRRELLRRESILKTMNAKRVSLYQACVASNNPQQDALNTNRINCEDLPGYIMKKYG